MRAQDKVEGVAVGDGRVKAAGSRAGFSLGKGGRGRRKGGEGGRRGRELERSGRGGGGGGGFLRAFMGFFGFTIGGRGPPGTTTPDIIIVGSKTVQ